MSDGPFPDEELRGELRDDLVRAMGRVPELSGHELRLTPLSGGITNRNFLVTSTGTTQRWVIRLAGNDTHLLGISREVEHAATVAAAGVGVGPEVTAFIRPEGYLVTRFIEGSAVSDEAVHRPETLRRVADSLRRIHDGPAIPGLFVPLRIAEAYRALAMARGVPIPAGLRPRRLPSGGASTSPAWRRPWICGPATTTCSTPTSSTTGRASGSSTGSTRAWATRSSTWAISASTTS